MTVAEQSELIRRLGKFYSIEDSLAWLNSPHPKLADRRPTRMPYHEVAAMMDRTEKSAFR